jgi:hypothetical protein
MPIRIKNPFKEEPTLEELEERQLRDTYNVEHIKAEAVINKLRAENKRWQDFSSNGKKSGFSMEKALAWLRGNKGGRK